MIVRYYKEYKDPGKGSVDGNGVASGRKEAAIRIVLPVLRQGYRRPSRLGPLAGDLSRLLCPDPSATTSSSHWLAAGTAVDVSKVESCRDP